MWIILVIFYFFLFILIPVSFILTINYCSNNGLVIKHLMLKGITSTVLHFIISGIIGFLVVFVIVGPHPLPGHLPGYENFLVAFLFIFIYGIIGWALCCFIAGKLIDFNIFWSKNKLQSIFNREQKIDEHLS